MAQSTPTESLLLFSLTREFFIRPHVLTLQRRMEWLSVKTHLLEVARALMFQMNVPKFLWSEAVMTAAYLINRMPSKVLGMRTPCEILLGANKFTVPPKVFGCTCFVRDYRPSVGKLDPESIRCIFVGYSASQKGYKCWCPTERRLFVSMDVTFRESEAFYKKKVELNSQLEDNSPSTVSTMREEEERTVITGEILLERYEDSCTPENSNQGEVRVPENQ